MIRSIVSGSSSGRLMVFYCDSLETTLFTDVKCDYYGLTLKLPLKAPLKKSDRMVIMAL